MAYSNYKNNYPYRPPSRPRPQMPYTLPQETFRAVKSADQSVPGGAGYSLLTFEDVLFDSGMEYDAATSSFVPRLDGVFLINATAAFSASGLADNAVFLMITPDNGTTGAQFSSNSMPGGEVNFDDISAILYLNAGDKIQIFARSTVPGTFLKDYTAFSAARLPSRPQGHPYAVRQ